MTNYLSKIILTNMSPDKHREILTDMPCSNSQLSKN